MALLAYGIVHPKIILFGEYSVLLNGEALTIPLEEFTARFDFMDNATDIELARQSNQKLREFAAYLESTDTINQWIDVALLLQDISDGLYLLSDVPQGYGLGSSGVVCAAIANTYSRIKKPIAPTNNDLAELKTSFSVMESYFHGQSSGIDPLACYINKPLLFNRDEINIIPPLSLSRESWFLIDTGISRKTDNLVKLFKNKLENNLYRQELEQNYLPLVNELIGQVHRPQTGNVPNTTTQPMPVLMEALSLMQLRYFKDMIACELLALWQHGLDTGKFYIKLLGAGGGGYFLGYTHDNAYCKSMFNASGFGVKFLG